MSAFSVISNAPFEITCWTSWCNRKLLIGTNAHGLVVYDISADPTQVKLDSVHPNIARCIKGKIQQLDVIDATSLLVLSDGAISIYDIRESSHLHFTHRILVYEKGIDCYCFQNSTLCYAVGCCVKSYAYTCSGQLDLLQSKRIVMHTDCTVVNMVLCSGMLYVSYRPAEYCATFHCVTTTTKPESPTTNVHTADEPILLRKVDYEQVLVHHHLSSTFLKRNSPTNKLYWTTSPVDIVVVRSQYFAVTGNTLHVAALQQTDKPTKVTINSKDPLMFVLVVNSDVFVANTDSVWRVPSHVTEYVTIDEFHPVVPTNKKFSYPSHFSPQDSLRAVGVLGITKRGLKAIHITNVGHLANISTSDLQRIETLGLLEAYLKAVTFVNIYYITWLGNTKKEETKPFTTNIGPDDMLDALGVPEQYFQFLASMGVYTVRQFAVLKDIAFIGEADLFAKHAEAVEIVQYNSMHSSSKIFYGYLAMTDSQFARVVESRAVKSAYVLFREYQEAAPEDRVNHPWKDVYYHYHDLAKFCGNSEVPLSDSDVFSYLCWRHALTFGNMDATAGARAFFFYTRNHQFPSEKYTNVLQINLTALCNIHGGKLFYRIKVGKGVEWRQANLQEFQFSSHKMYEEFTTPTSCIVMPSGIIDWEYIDWF
jgi:hypothetical protein